MCGIVCVWVCVCLCVYVTFFLVFIIFFSWTFFFVFPLFCLVGSSERRQYGPPSFSLPFCPFLQLHFLAASVDGSVGLLQPRNRRQTLRLRRLLVRLQVHGASRRRRKLTAASLHLQRRRNGRHLLLHHDLRRLLLHAVRRRLRLRVVLLRLRVRGGSRRRRSLRALLLRGLVLLGVGLLRLLPLRLRLLLLVVLLFVVLVLVGPFALVAAGDRPLRAATLLRTAGLARCGGGGCGGGGGQGWWWAAAGTAGGGGAGRAGGRAPLLQLVLVLLLLLVFVKQRLILVRGGPEAAPHGSRSVCACAPPRWPWTSSNWAALRRTNEVQIL
eukprot:Rhum_TRINITY_DN15378_c14_g1::Rhum_TRINITY_DN15378_c14_g1_i1::g.154388::m.154388